MSKEVLIINKVLCAIILCGVLATNTVTVLGANNSNTSAIDLVSYDYNALKVGTSDEIDEILYPSGLELPTKYMDFLDFTPYSGKTITNNVASYLNEEYPSANAKFTYAEYRAAERYLYFYDILRDEENTQLRTALDSLFSEIGINEIGVRLSNTSRFSNALDRYEDILYKLAEGSKLDNDEGTLLGYKLLDSFYITIGLGDVYTDVTTDSNALQKYLEYLETVDSYWDYFGLKFFKVSESDASNAENTGDSGSSQNTFIFSEAFTVTDENISTHDRQITIGESPRSLDSLESISSEQIAISDTKIFNFRDFITWACFIVIVIAVISVCIKHTISNYKEERNRWRL